MVSRGFGFYSTIISIVLMLLGMIIGANQSSPATAGLYGVIIVQLINFCDFYQFFLKQIMNS